MIQNEIECYAADGKTCYKKLKLPKVFFTPIRSELVVSVQNRIKRNTMRPYAVDPEAGMRHSAHSWGTGRALARVPRISGGGSRRAGQGAFANFCRQGRMASPTSVLRRWQRKTNLTTRRHAAAMAVAASASAALVESRGHRISHLKQIPLVVTSEIESMKKTKSALELLHALGLTEELVKVKSSKSLRRGRGKCRNRRWVYRKGLLVVYSEDNGLTKAFRNIKGVDLMRVDLLDIMQLAPGGHVGRLILWTESAFERLRVLYGDDGIEGVKGSYRLPESKIHCPDPKMLLKSEEVQALFDKKPELPCKKVKGSPEKILSLNPYLHLFNEVKI